MTHTIPKNSGSKQVLDTLKVEKERGITVKAQTASLKYTPGVSGLAGGASRTYLLNLIDTPGHVDFTWEGERRIVPVHILAFMSGQSLEHRQPAKVPFYSSTQLAQTISVFHSARERGLKIIPILNKIDLPAADTGRITSQLSATFGIDPEDCLHISAKTGQGVESVLEQIVSRIPPPAGVVTSPFRGLLFDSFFDRFRGVIMLLYLEGGVLRKGKKYEVVEVGVMNPGETPTGELRAGQVGYIACNMKDPSEAHIGDTFHHTGKPVAPLIGFQPNKAMVYSGVFPFDTSEFPRLEESIKRLTLTDRSVTVQRESSTALGQGCRLGFLGTLHMDVFRQRLEDEYDASVIITAPTVPYKVVYRSGSDTIIRNPVEFPEYGDPKVLEIQEPYVKGSIIVPQEYVGQMMELCAEHRADDISDIRYLDNSGDTARVLLQCRLPLGEIVSDFFEKLKGRSSGFASFDYEEDGYQRSPLHKMVFLLNGKPVDALATIVHDSVCEDVGRKWALKLKEVIPRQNFEVPIQALVKNKVVARETISAMRKDLKHLNKQKEGKARLKRIGKVDLPQEAFFTLLSSNNKK
ncbi:Translation factor GUF1 homolog, mitochondrial {ECO:0000255/HAMAP-Rule:MF_03137}; AltName: Full=Elongation factor 4 homolog {ECO:0000255/HAMAP-Rule:MF_03137}; Short=EF-4 {ECO:0000255/HAMAP-Rule:MF_03137}; AltName: Full=GTPase GUF1 homolog {ECO:0000255/HAMAP-Rule:MF_03137}; AltName: Full=Ribosomal back-translocase {ECO:0000255/HAMAP-Rule:MF_03137}; Flags: Precursor [Serendipita indica DSM 11827]|nr:Translation factor GUF1 homolog, mitochondrial {ECO:0000255/HAMAP-Rule:MF_03137}; AltName: Full=Elongation factor 4 homolog {ECO:0000255/HAMAP-Rule:MF_03137}; Short=EF-4 {ECO:0000255/HAMAP-Rule:MF_03137}; AltName: Full=GTPase GUF1 homolog {ECO:0000255/HAMAP-Rule:MF_03137}; AltName: Full=Ribosomal back-translocase {ECO:0000255/HAMAP-Rule:MF_03137}; Flags: Precursor [Serendipita indica DSM 11827]